MTAGETAHFYVGAEITPNKENLMAQLKRYGRELGGRDMEWSDIMRAGNGLKNYDGDVTDHCEFCGRAVYYVEATSNMFARKDEQWRITCFKSSDTTRASGIPTPAFLIWHGHGKLDEEIRLQIQQTYVPRDFEEHPLSISFASSVAPQFLRNIGGHYESEGRQFALAGWTLLRHQFYAAHKMHCEAYKQFYLNAETTSEASARAALPQPI